MSKLVKYRVNWGNGQVDYTLSIDAARKLIKEDIYGKFAFIQKRVGCEEWEKLE